MEFSDIALAKLLQTVPELGSLIINFQDVTEELEEDSGTKVGVFVLRSGGDIFYIPVVSKNATSTRSTPSSSRPRTGSSL